LEIDNLGNVYVFGRGHTSSINPYGAFTIVKYNSIGNIIWITNDSLGSMPTKITLKNNRYIFVTGSKGYKMYSVGYDSSGNKIFSASYPNPITSRAYGGKKVLFDKNNGIYILGSCTDTLILFKYLLPTNIGGTSINIPDRFELFQNYPNPFNPSTNIKYQIKENSFVTLKIFDVLGKEIAVPVNEKQRPGSYEVQFDARHGGSSSLPTGVYYYVLYADGERMDARKMVLLK
jgi:hypothetical protein